MAAKPKGPTLVGSDGEAIFDSPREELSLGPGNRYGEAAHHAKQTQTGLAKQAQMRWAAKAETHGQ
jgi:hypothetical protein